MLVSKEDKMKNQEKVNEVLNNELFAKLTKEERRYLTAFIEGVTVAAELREEPVRLMHKDKPGGKTA